MSNLGFEPGWVSSTTRNLTSWAKPTLLIYCILIYLIKCFRLLFSKFKLRYTEFWYESLKDGVVDIKRQGDKIILVKLLVGDLICNVISAYDPQIGLNESVKRQFWEELDALVSSVPISENLFIAGDLNGHVDSIRVGFDRYMGISGMGVGTKKVRVS
jgi:hypothetical protein